MQLLRLFTSYINHLKILNVIWFSAVFNSKWYYILPTGYIYVFYVYLRIKQQLFPYTVLTDWFL
jgi:hypothetical protein